MKEKAKTGLFLQFPVIGKKKIVRYETIEHPGEEFPFEVRCDLSELNEKEREDFIKIANEERDKIIEGRVYEKNRKS